MQDFNNKIYLKSTKTNIAECISYGFFGRVGGYSKGNLATLNIGLSSLEEKEITIKNRNIVEDSMNFKKNSLVIIKQTHSNLVFNVVDVNSTAEGDAIVSNKEGVLIGVLTADCAPVIFADDINKVVGVCHAGWAGAFSDIMKNTVEKMVEIGAKKSDIKAIVGPCIHQKSYEVSDDFFQKFILENSFNKNFFINSIKKSHYMFDLPNYIKNKIDSLNIFSTEIIDYDTYSHEKMFYSHRRMKHNNESSKGLQVSVIGIK